jgi:AraC family transcriptional regulator
VSLPFSADSNPTFPAVEQSVWSRVEGLWKPIFGSFYEQGISIEWHDFFLREILEWSGSFHTESLEICLNYAGRGALQNRDVAATLEPEQVACYTTRAGQLKAQRFPDSMHRFLTIEVSASYLGRQFGSAVEGLKAPVREFMENPAGFTSWLEIGAMPVSLLTMRLHLVDPPVQASAQNTWYEGKILEVLSQVLFRSDLFSEQRSRRPGLDRVERVKFLLERDLENPPSLSMLAREVDCSPFYLSRLFVRETGVSLPKYLRTKRIEKAADLLASGKMNVTQAAAAVGYASLSAFYRAFIENKGVCPGLYHLPVNLKKPKVS